MKHWYLPTSAGGEVDVLDDARRRPAPSSGSAASPRFGAAGVDDGEGDVVERLGPAGAEVEDAARLRMLEEPEVDRDHVVDDDEVAALLARARSRRTRRTA